MLSIIGEFGSRLQVPDPEETTEPVPDEYKTLMDDWEQAQNKFEQWTILARMKDILTSFDCMVDAVRAASTQKSKRAVVRGIGKHRSEWSQMPSLEEMAEPEIANEYKIMMDEWEQVEHKFEQWALDEIPAVGSA